MSRCNPGKYFPLPRKSKRALLIALPFPGATVHTSAGFITQCPLTFSFFNAAQFNCRILDEVQHLQNPNLLAWWMKPAGLSSSAMWFSLRAAHFGLLSQVSGKQCHFILPPSPLSDNLKLVLQFRRGWKGCGGFDRPTVTKKLWGGLKDLKCIKWTDQEQAEIWRFRGRLKKWEHSHTIYIQLVHIRGRQMTKVES